MAEHTRPWSERTVDLPPQDPWAEPTAPSPAAPRTGHPAPFGQTAPYAPAAPSSPAAPYAPAAPFGPTAGYGPPEPPAAAYQRGVAAVRPVAPRADAPVAPHEPTGTGWPGAGQPRERQPMGWHLRQLRRGGGWSNAGALFFFVCWGILTLSNGGALTMPAMVLVLTVAVAVGLFALARLVGRLVWERQLGRVRRTATGAHLVAGLFLAGVGFAHLQQTSWVMNLWRWLQGLF